MADILTAHPTSSDLATLTTLLPSTPPPLPNAPHLLQSLINLCSPKWISDFLFTTDPIHIPHLTSPQLAQNALLSHISTTRTGPSETMHNFSRFLFLPAFIADHTTYGFGVMKGAELRGSSLQQSIPLTMPLRFLRNAKTRQFLMVNDTQHASLDCTLMYYSIQTSATTTSAFTARFKRSVLLDSLRKNNGYLQVSTLLSALLYILEERYVRACPSCNCTSCLCILPTREAIHPYDFSSFTHGFLQDFGEFQGVASKFTEQGTHAVQSVRVRMQGVVDSGVISEMARWAVRTTLRCSWDPMESVLFGKYGSVQTDHVTESESGDVVGELLQIEQTSWTGSPVSGNRKGNVDALDGFELLGNGEVQGKEWWECEQVECRGGADVTADLEKALRRKKADERRKERNRESAKRSNARNKIKRKKEQEEFLRFIEKEQELRLVENSLRKENLRLKELVRESGR